jgi:hypothetical protein
MAFCFCIVSRPHKMHFSSKTGQISQRPSAPICSIFNGLNNKRLQQNLIKGYFDVVILEDIIAGI